MVVLNAGQELQPLYNNTSLGKSGKSTQVSRLVNLLDKGANLLWICVVESAAHSVCRPALIRPVFLSTSSNKSIELRLRYEDLSRPSHPTLRH